MSEGRVEAIYITAEHGELPHAVESVRAIAGKGLEGNRYFDEGRPVTELTLIEVEALEQLAAEHGIELDAAASRRNVLTRGIDLNDLVGKTFHVGRARVPWHRAVRAVLVPRVEDDAGDRQGPRPPCRSQRRDPRRRRVPPGRPGNDLEEDARRGLVRAAGRDQLDRVVQVGVAVRELLGERQADSRPRSGRGGASSAPCRARWCSVSMIWAISLISLTSAWFALS